MTKIVKEMFGELSLWGKFWLWLGLASLAAAAGMSIMVALHSLAGGDVHA